MAYVTNVLILREWGDYVEISNGNFENEKLGQLVAGLLIDKSYL